MGNDVCCGQLTAKPMNKPANLFIEKVSNGFIVGGYGMERKVTLTIGEALEIIRKEME